MPALLLWADLQLHYKPGLLDLRPAGSCRESSPSSAQDTAQPPDSCLGSCLWPPHPKMSSLLHKTPPQVQLAVSPFLSCIGPLCMPRRHAVPLLAALTDVILQAQPALQLAQRRLKFQSALSLEVQLLHSSSSSSSSKFPQLSLNEARTCCSR